MSQPVVLFQLTQNAREYHILFWQAVFVNKVIVFSDYAFFLTILEPRWR